MSSKYESKRKRSASDDQDAESEVLIAPATKKARGPHGGVPQDKPGSDEALSIDVTGARPDDVFTGRLSTNCGAQVLLHAFFIIARAY
jgi:hypothetical protein